MWQEALRPTSALMGGPAVDSPHTLKPFLLHGAPSPGGGDPRNQPLTSSEMHFKSSVCSAKQTGPPPRPWSGHSRREDLRQTGRGHLRGNVVRKSVPGQGSCRGPEGECLGQLRLRQQNTGNRVAPQQQGLVPHSSGGRKSTVGVPAAGGCACAVSSRGHRWLALSQGH